MAPWETLCGDNSLAGLWTLRAPSAIGRLWLCFYRGFKPSDLTTKSVTSYLWRCPLFKISLNLVFTSDERTGSSGYSLRHWEKQSPVPLLALTLPMGFVRVPFCRSSQSPATMSKTISNWSSEELRVKNEVRNSLG